MVRLSGRRSTWQGEKGSSVLGSREQAGVLKKYRGKGVGEDIVHGKDKQRLGRKEDDKESEGILAASEIKGNRLTV